MATSSSQISNVSSSQNEDSKLARNLYIKTAKLEKELQNTLRRKSPLDKSISQLRQEIRTNYENIMFLDIAYAATKDIDQMLWKCVFYKPIEEFRKIIKKYQGSTEDPKAKEKLQKMTSSFLAFLDESSVYYEELFSKFEEKYNQAKQQQPTNQQLVKLLSTSLHKCLIILGDLARYVQLYNEKPTKDWSVAASNYSRALELMPSNGNPHNQLAVLATYQNDDCEAIYRYFRSLSVKKPFVSARENLTILFEKNRQKFIKISTGAQQSNGPNFARRKKKKYYKEVTRSNEEVRERFMVSFIRLHGILFTKTSVETFEEVLRNTLRDFEVACTFLTEDMILKLMIMNIFSVDNAAKNDTSGVILQYAVNLAYSTFATVVVYSLQTESLLSNMGSIVTFLRYIRLHRDIIGSFKREAAYMFEKVAEFLNILFNQPMDIPEEEIDDTEAILPEDAELFGFLPLQESKVTLSGKVNVSGDHMFLAIRAKRIRLLSEEFVADSQFDIFYENGIYTTHSTEERNVENLPTTQPQGEDQYDHNGFINPYSEFNEDAYVDEVPENEIVADGEGEFPDEDNEQPREGGFVAAGMLAEEENDEDNVEEDEVFVFKPELGEAPAASTVIDRPFGNHVGQHFAAPAPVPQQWNNSMMSHLMQSQQREDVAPPSSFYGSSLFSPTNPTFFLGSNFYGQQQPPTPNAKPPATNNGWPAYHAKVIERPFQQPSPQQTPEAPNGRIIERPFGAPAPTSPFFGWGAYPMAQYPPQPAIPTMDILMNTSNAKNQQAQQPPAGGFNNAVFGFAQQNGAAQQTRGRNPFT